MAEGKKTDTKKEEKKESTGINIFGISIAEIFVYIMIIFSFLFVILPRTTPQGVSEYQKKEQGVFEGVDIGQTINEVFDEKVEVVRDSDGKVVNTIKKKSLFENTKSKAKDLFYDISLFIFSIAIFLSLLFYSICLYTDFLTKEIKKAYIDKINPKGIKDDIGSASLGIDDTNGISNPRWDIVMAYSQSANPSDWRLAILEADMMLYDILDKSGFIGESIGEKLKSIDGSKLANIDLAWKAHKIRNRIAHDGTNFIIKRNEVDDVIDSYKRVFEELNFI